MDVGPAELVIVLVIVLVLFGGKKLPELARSLGQAQREFAKGAQREGPDDGEVEVPDDGTGVGQGAHVITDPWQQGPWSIQLAVETEPGEDDDLMEVAL